MGRALSLVSLIGIIFSACEFPTTGEGTVTSLAKDTVWIEISNAEILERPFFHAALLLMAGIEKAPDSLKDTLTIALRGLLENGQVLEEMKAFMEEQNRVEGLYKTGGRVCMDTVRGLPFSSEIFQITLCIAPEITPGYLSYHARMTSTWSFAAFTIFGRDAYDYTGELLLSMTSLYGSFGNLNPYHDTFNLDLGQTTVCVRYAELTAETLAALRALLATRGLGSALVVFTYLAFLLNDFSDTPVPWSACGFLGNGDASIAAVAQASPSISTWTRTNFQVNLIFNPHAYVFRVSTEIW